MFFRDNFAFLSNFYPCTINTKHGVFRSSEHLYQASKSQSPLIWETVRNHPSKGLKAFAKTIDIRNDWDIVKLPIMEKILNLKFTQHPDLKAKLQKISGIIIEHNEWHDNYWGSCTCNRCKDRKFNNYLGQLLMKIRDGK